MKLSRRFLSVFLGVVLSVALGPAVGMAKDTITVAGSSTVKPIVQAAAAVFGRAHGVKFSIKGGGSSVGVKSAGTGATDIGDASRDIKDKEMAKWPSLVPHTIGRDGVTMILHNDLGISSLNKEQIQKIYMGEITNWKDMGGPDEPIILIDKEEGRSTLELFLHFAGLEGKEIDGGKHMIHARKGDDKWSTVKARIIGSNQQALVQVANKKGAIGYVSVGDAVAYASKTHKIVLPDINGVAATVANVKNSTFPITRPLNVVTKGEATGVVKDFIDFLFSAKGQAIVAKKNFVPVK